MLVRALTGRVRVGTKGRHVGADVGRRHGLDGDAAAAVLARRRQAQVLDEHLQPGVGKSGSTAGGLLQAGVGQLQGDYCSQEWITTRGLLQPRVDQLQGDYCSQEWINYRGTTAAARSGSSARGLLRPRNCTGALTRECERQLPFPIARENAKCPVPYTIARENVKCPVLYTIARGNAKCPVPYTCALEQHVWKKGEGSPVPSCLIAAGSYLPLRTQLSGAVGKLPNLIAVIHPQFPGGTLSEAHNHVKQNYIHFLIHTNLYNRTAHPS